MSHGGKELCAVKLRVGGLRHSPSRPSHRRTTRIRGRDVIGCGIMGPRTEVFEVLG